MPQDDIPFDQQSTYLVVPYFSNDMGRPGIERPLPPASAPATIPWACPSIKVIGGSPGTFVPGQPLSVTVTVANHGAGTGIAPVNVSVWWSDPSTGFTKTNLHGQAVLAVPSRGGVATTKPIVKAMPSTAPKHLCLLARVSSPADAPAVGAPIDPVNDRHWAQLNLNAVTTTGGAFQFTFYAGNSSDTECSIRVEARPVNEGSLESMAEFVGRRPVYAGEIGTDILVLDEQGRPIEGQSPDSIVLAPGERQQLLVGGQLPVDLEPGEFVGLELVQRCDDKVTGSIGLMLIPDEG